MIRETITYKYARALSQYAKEKNSLEKIKEDFLRLKKILWDNKDVRFYFLFPLERAEKLDFLAVIQKHLSVEEGLFRFLRLLVEEDRFRFFLDIYEKFLDVYQELKKKTQVKIRSAFALSKEQEKDILSVSEKIFKQELIVESIIDKSLWAGAVLFFESENVKIDLSAAHTLDRLKEELGQ